jgi:PhzF family phenazine biosynthesis protein
MRQRRVYQVDAFTRRRFAGNPAGVVPDARGLSDTQMQCLARELNNSETAFILPADANDHDVRVRFFTPFTEVPICGHATIAAHFVRAVEGAPSGVARQLTGAGILDVEIEENIEADGGIWMHQQVAQFERILDGDVRSRLLAALGLHADALRDDAPIQIVSTGHSKVVIPLRNRAQLNQLTPELAQLSSLSRDIGCNGFYPFALEGADDTLTSGRMFAPAIGISEDPVTGNASGCLGAYLLHHRLQPADRGGRLHFTASQGEMCGRPGTVDVEAWQRDGAIHVRIRGQAVLAFCAEIML